MIDPITLSSLNDKFDRSICLSDLSSIRGRVVPMSSTEPQPWPPGPPAEHAFLPPEFPVAVYGPLGDEARGWCAPRIYRIDDAEQFATFFAREADYWERYSDLYGWRWDIHPWHNVLDGDADQGLIDGESFYRLAMDGDGIVWVVSS